MPSSAQSLIISAVANGYDRLSDRGLKECLLYASQTGGGGGGGGGLSGSGSPQNVVAGSAGQTYTDVGVNPPNFWVNTTGATSGWVELIGN